MDALTPQLTQSVGPISVTVQGDGSIRIAVAESPSQFKAGEVVIPRCFASLVADMFDIAATRSRSLQDPPYYGTIAAGLTYPSVAAG